MPDTLLIKNGIVVTLGEQNRVIDRGAVLCTGDKITKVGEAGQFHGPYDREIDASGAVVLPGLINAHMHFYSTLARGLGQAEPASDFLEVLDHLWWRLDKKLTLDDCYYSALVPCLDAIKHGTTTLIDHHASPLAVEGSLDRLAAAVNKTGLRASLCYEVSDRDGPAIAQAGIEENVRFIKRCQRSPDSQLRALFGLHASFTLGDRTLERAAAAANGLGTGFHIHVAEALADQKHSRANFQKRVVQRLNDFTILGGKTIAAHGVHLDASERKLLQKSGTAVVHNPQSNMNNAVGVAGVIKMTGQGILVGLGTDAMTVNMLEEVRAGLWAQHLAQENPSVGFGEIVAALLQGNARIASRYWEPPLGELREGCAADIIAIAYEPPTPFEESTFPGHLVFGLSQSVVKTTVVGGRVLMENRQLQIDVDEAEIAAKARELAAALWKRF